MGHKGISVKYLHNWKKEKNRKNEFYIQVRITLERVSRYFAIEELPKIPTKYWSGKENRWVKDTYPQGSTINSFLIKKLNQLDEFLLEARMNHGTITFDLIKTEFFRKGAVKTLNEFFKEYIENTKFDAARTKQAYSTSLQKIDEFNPSIPINSLSEKLINDFINWEKNTNNLKDVTIDKHLGHVKTIIKELIKVGLLNKNPIEHSRFKLKPEKADRTALTKEEVKALQKVKFTQENSHLEKHRDIFIFLCMTGLYYSDAIELKKDNIIDEKLIQGFRTKNDHPFIVPLSPAANKIVQKYNLPDTNNVFPKLASEQAFNRSIKEVAKLAKLKKTLRNKVGRHTFTELAISNGIERSFVSKMLGHKKESTTQYYYDINGTHILERMKNKDFLM